LSVISPRRLQHHPYTYSSTGRCVSSWSVWMLVSRTSITPRRSCPRADTSSSSSLALLPIRPHRQPPAGKTTILYKLKLGEIVTTIPTIGTCRFPPLAANPACTRRARGLCQPARPRILSQLHRAEDIHTDPSLTRFAPASSSLPSTTAATVLLSLSLRQPTSRVLRCPLVIPRLHGASHPHRLQCRDCRI